MAVRCAAIIRSPQSQRSLVEATPSDRRLQRNKGIDGPRNWIICSDGRVLNWTRPEARFECCNRVTLGAQGEVEFNLIGAAGRSDVYGMRMRMIMTVCQLKGYLHRLSTLMHVRKLGLHSITGALPERNKVGNPAQLSCFLHSERSMVLSTPLFPPIGNGREGNPARRAARQLRQCSAGGRKSWAKASLTVVLAEPPEQISSRGQ